MEQEKLNYNLKETPWYFGAYLNMARHNLFLLINHLTETFSYLGYSVIAEDDCIDNKNHIIAKVFDTQHKIAGNDRYKVFKYLTKRHYLPFIKIFHEKKGVGIDKNPIVDYNKLHNFLTEIFTLLNDFRNSYTHFLTIDDNGNIVGTRRNEVPPIVKKYLLELFQQSSKYSLSRFEATQKSENYEHLKLYKLFEDNSHQLTEHGFYFLINLFLERAYAIKFLKKIRGFKDERTPRFRATIQAFTAYAVRLPDKRLWNEDKKDSLLLEMLNELQKCPKELYNHLTDNDKAKFEPKLDAESVSNLLNNTNYDKIEDVDIDSFLSGITSLKRYSNRFPYFVLRYIDEFNLLPNIRFQITLGRLQVKQYEKEIAGATVNRRILKTVNAFGKLSDFENKEDEVLIKIGINSKESIIFDQYAPHYNLNNNKIGFYIVMDSKIKYPILFENNMNNKPHGFISLHDLPKLILLAYFANQKAEKLITGFIKKNEKVILNIEKLNNVKSNLSLIPEQFTRRLINEKALKGETGKIEYLNNDKIKGLKRVYPSLLNADFVTKKISNTKLKEYADQIRYLNYLKERRKELQNQLPKDVLVDQLPTEVFNFLLNISNPSQEKVIHVKIKAIKEDCKWRRKILDREKAKPNSEQTFQLGEIATFLTRDIIDMVIEKKVKQKITSTYYDMLQNKIAYFSISKVEIKNICQVTGLIDNQNGHVFLTEEMIQNSSGILDFYKIYLEEKINWIDRNLFIKGKVRGYYIPDSKKIPYNYRRIKQKLNKKNFTKWIENKLEMPVNLPNSLFDNLIKKVLHKQLDKENIDYDKDGDTFSVLIAKLLKDDTQPFYNFDRIYLKNEREVIASISGLTAKQIKNIFGVKAAKNEKKIRFIQSQDRIIRLLCDIMIDNSEKPLKLNYFMPFSNISPLNLPFKFQQNIVKNDNEMYFKIIAKDDDKQIEEIKKYQQLETDEEIINYQGQKGYEWTIKDFGRFKRFINDRRIPGLSHYFEKNEIDFDLIKYQLTEYDKYRELVFKAIIELEQKIVSKDFEGIKKLENKHRSKKDFFEVQFCVYLEWLKNNNIYTDQQLDMIEIIRNKFSHSEFPYICGLIEISSTDLTDFVKIKREKGEVESLNLSISKHLYDLLVNMIKGFPDN